MAEGKWANPPWPVWALVTILVAAVPVLLNRSNDQSTPSPKAESAQPSKPAVLPNLTYGTWTLRNAVDDSGYNWSNTTLKFTSQDESAAGLLLTGVFNWRLDNEFMGKEQFTGRYVAADRQIILEGIHIDQHDTGTNYDMATGNYSAVVSPDNRKLLDGTWGSTERDTATAMPTLPGKWEAIR